MVARVVETEAGTEAVERAEGKEEEGRAAAARAAAARAAVARAAAAATGSVERAAEAKALSSPAEEDSSCLKSLARSSHLHSWSESVRRCNRSGRRYHSRCQHHYG